MNIKKILILIFVSIFVLIYAIFNGDAFISLVRYKYSKLIDSFKNEMRRPLNLNFLTTNTTANTVNTANIINTTTTVTLSRNIWDNIFSRRATTTTTKIKVVLPALPEEALTTNILELPEFKIKAPILQPNKASLKEIYALLRKGVVLFPGSSELGGDYSIIIGHSSSYPWTPGRYKSVFSLLNEFKIGDRFYVYANQKPLVYEIKDKKIFLPWPKGSDTTETLFPPENNKHILILQSCWPVGVDFKRVAIKAELISE